MKVKNLRSLSIGRIGWIFYMSVEVVKRVVAGEMVSQVLKSSITKLESEDYSIAAVRRESGIISMCIKGMEVFRAQRGR